MIGMGHDPRCEEGSPFLTGMASPERNRARTSVETPIEPWTSFFEARTAGTHTYIQYWALLFNGDLERSILNPRHNFTEPLKSYAQSSTVYSSGEDGAITCWIEHHL